MSNQQQAPLAQQEKPKTRSLITINTSNHVANTNRYIFRFPQSVNFKNAHLSVNQISMYNSTYNISTDLGNNTFSIYWLGTKYSYTIPDGYYDIPSLTAFIQYCMTGDKLYVTSNSGKDITYFIELSTNTIQYKIQLDILYIPTSTQATTLGYSKPTGATWNYPVSSQTPQFEISSGLQTILGLKQATIFPTVVQTTTQSFLSSTYPVLSPVFCYIVCCNLISSGFNNVPTILYQLPLTASYGNLVSVTNQSESRLNIRDGIYNEIQITLLDQNYNTLKVNDPEIILNLVIEQ